MAEPDAGAEWTEHSVRPYEDGWTVEQVLTRSLMLDRRELQRLHRERGVRVNRAPAALTRRVAHTDVVAVRRGGEPEPSGIDATPVEFGIVHEDDHVLVVDKPPYLLVHPKEPGQRHTLVNGISHHYREHGIDARIHPVHRLDRDTSGLLLIAKTPDAHRFLGEQLISRALKREYIAVVSGEPRDDRGTVDAPIGRHPTQPVLRAVRPDGEDARTHFHVIERLNAAAAVGLELETGRTHQIRVHMAYLGHPLLGDRQYGRRGQKRIGRQALHAARISFVHPGTRERVAFDARVPDDIRRLIADLRAG